MIARMSRRTAILGGAALAALASCKGKGGDAGRATPAPPLPPSLGGVWKDLAFDPAPDWPEGQRALALLPEGGAALPLLVALHGRGESGRGLDVGAGAWPRDYALERMLRRLASPPLTAADLQQMADPARLAKLNASLAAAPYKGMALACPYTPDLRDRTPAGAQGFARFVIDALLPRLRAERGSKADRAATGIDGVSMGGRLALLVGLTHPEVFGVVGALQPAIRVDEAPLVSELARAAMAKARVLLRLVSSDDDPFLPAVRAASERLRADGVEHELLVTPGNHGYEFNRGPGGAEMLLWHERVQRGLAAP